jgi:hypothetical protein
MIKGMADVTVDARPDFRSKGIGDREVELIRKVSFGHEAHQTEVG